MGVNLDENPRCWPNHNLVSQLFSTCRLVERINLLFLFAPLKYDRRSLVSTGGEWKASPIGMRLSHMAK